jgi:hypothetical protein
MKKILVLALVMVMTMAFVLGAQAAVYEFKEFASHGFSLDVPDGWFVTEDKFSNRFDFDSPDGAIIIGRIGGIELITFLCVSQEALYGHTFAIAISQGIEGSDPVEYGNGDFVFTYNESGVETNVRTRNIGHLGIVMESQDDFEEILDILETLL